MASSIKNAIGGFFVGGAMFLAAFPVLFMNEGCAVRIAKSLDEGLGAVNANVPAEPLKPEFEGKLVHMSAPAETADILKDDRFGVEVNAVKLERTVEMYQWNERSRKGKNQRRIYDYDLKWRQGRIDSGRFHNKSGHINPGLPFKSQTQSAQNVTFGAHRLSDSLIARITGSKPLEAKLADIKEPLRSRLLDTADGLYLPAKTAPASSRPAETTSPAAPAGDPATGDPATGDPAGAADSGKRTAVAGRVAAPAPQLGDVRVTFHAVYGDDVSIVSQQRGDTFQPFPTSVGLPVEMLSMGTVSAEQMFEDAKNANIIRTWAVRAGGAALMFFGVMLLFSPLTQFSDYVPILGNLVGGAVAVVAFLVAAGCSLITISLAWLYYRPLLGVPLLLLGVFCIAMLVYFFFFRQQGDGPQTMEIDDGIREIN